MTAPRLTYLWICLAIVCSLQQTNAQTTENKSEQQITLPTENDHIFNGEGDKFYMYVYRNFEDKQSQPWSGGTYGFVRNMKRTEDGVIGTRFHEGIDIKPLKRDRAYKPLDEIKSIASGTVAYVNASSSRSNYGKYVVIEHLWECGPIYSLYAHLATISVQVGEPIQQGQIIGIMGYTGSGLNKDRSHLHLELNLMLSEKFTPWHQKHFGGTNYHGIHNGINMAGLDIGGYYITQKKNSSLTIPQFIKTQQIYYKITIPRKQKGKDLSILRRYPWLAQSTDKSPSWEISFTASGLPVAITPSQRETSSPRVTFVKPCRSQHSYHTKGFLTGTGNRASLSNRGKRFIELIAETFVSE